MMPWDVNEFCGSIEDMTGPRISVTRTLPVWVLRKRDWRCLRRAGKPCVSYLPVILFGIDSFTSFRLALLCGNALGENIEVDDSLPEGARYDGLI